MAGAEDLKDFLGIPRTLIPWFPSIDDDLCSNCGLCVDACKHQTYAFTDSEKVHPQLCVDDGDRFWQDLAKPGTTYVVGGCDPKMQRKMYKDALAAVGANFDEQVVALDLRNMPTEEAMQKVAAAFEKLSQAQG